MIILLSLVGCSRLPSAATAPRQATLSKISIDRHSSLLRRFYELLLQRQTPTVREYQEIFGHHAEWELARLLAFCQKQGWTPVDQSTTCVSYTRAVLSQPAAHESSFFQALRNSRDLLWQPPDPDGRPNVFVGWSVYGERDDRVSLEVGIRRANGSRLDLVEFWLSRFEEDVREYGHIIDIRIKGASLLARLSREND